MHVETGNCYVDEDGISDTDNIPIWEYAPNYFDGEEEDDNFIFLREYDSETEKYRTVDVIGTTNYNGAEYIYDVRTDDFSLLKTSRDQGHWVFIARDYGTTGISGDHLHLGDNFHINTNPFEVVTYKDEHDPIIDYFKLHWKSAKSKIKDQAMAFVNQRAKYPDGNYNITLTNHFPSVMPDSSFFKTTVPKKNDGIKRTGFGTDHIYLWKEYSKISFAEILDKVKKESIMSYNSSDSLLLLVFSYTNVIELEDRVLYDQEPPKMQVLAKHNVTEANSLPVPLFEVEQLRGSTLYGLPKDFNLSLQENAKYFVMLDLKTVIY